MVEFPIPRTVKQFALQFSHAGFSLFIVGGAVRDYFLGRATSDFDFATDAQPDEVMNLFPSVIPTGIKHGTVSVLFRGSSYEVTTFRIDGDYRDARHPETVHFVRSLQEDLKRRDFTINALAVNAFTGEIHDFHNGLKDIDIRLIRAIGNPVERFNEDALRILRACRFVSQLDFSIHNETLSAMKSYAHKLQQVSGERVKNEFWKILESPLPSKGIYTMYECGALAIWFPELTMGDQITQKGFHTLDVMRHGIAACDAVSRTKPLVRLAALLHDIGKVPAKQLQPSGDVTFHRHEEYSVKLAKKILTRLKCSNQEQKVVLNLIQHHMFHYTPEWSDGAVRRFVNRVGKEALDDLFSLRLADQIAIHGTPSPHAIMQLEKRIKKVIETSSAFSIQDLAISGNDLAILGIPRGPEMGIVLHQLLETVLDDPSENEYEKLRVIAWNFYEQRIKQPKEQS
jgi:poly(A) polymerase/tRNA nucleotidyltransferase (CCA-adding enzyme)